MTISYGPEGTEVRGQRSEVGSQRSEVAQRRNSHVGRIRRDCETARAAGAVHLPKGGRSGGILGATAIGRRVGHFVPTVSFRKNLCARARRWMQCPGSRRGSAWGGAAIKRIGLYAGDRRVQSHSGRDGGIFVRLD